MDGLQVQLPGRFWRENLPEWYVYIEVVVMLPREPEAFSSKPKAIKKISDKC